MRTLIAGLGATIATLGMSVGTADAQRVVQRGPGASYPVPGRPGMAPVPAPAQQWQIRDGRWIAGRDAPGGWNGYRRPFVGWALPPYWTQPGFTIGDWSSYGLTRPPFGYRWSRYYDDAVLINARGSVYDTVSGVDWDGYGDRDAGYDRGPDHADADGYPVAPDYPPEEYRDIRRSDDGLGGAAIGAVAGGVAGNVIAGRGDRLGGTLIGAGVGATAGYAIDRAEDRDRRGPPPPPRYGAGHPPPPPGYDEDYPPLGPGAWVSPDGRTTVTTGAGYHGGGTTTTVVVQSAPVVTTTTTEYLDDSVTYSKPAKRKVYRRKVRPSKTICRC